MTRTAIAQRKPYTFSLGALVMVIFLVALLGVAFTRGAEAANDFVDDCASVLVVVVLIGVTFSREARHV
jgi:hypothetical protein